MSLRSTLPLLISFYFTNTAITEIYTLSLHDALPISREALSQAFSNTSAFLDRAVKDLLVVANDRSERRSEEHTSELQSHVNLVCRLLLEKKKGSSARSMPGPPLRPYVWA